MFGSRFECLGRFVDVCRKVFSLRGTLEKNAISYHNLHFDAIVRVQKKDFVKGKALRVIPRGKYRLTVYRAHQVL